MDAAGDIFGTTYGGGSKNDGTVFELSPPAAGQTAWTEKALHSFNGANGQQPNLAGLVADGAGNLYGTTQLGGRDGAGEVFELSPPPAGRTRWTEKVLRSFNGTDGNNPQANLIADGAGNLYGTTLYGGTGMNGNVFKLSPPTAGQTDWTEKVLHTFDGADGLQPGAGLVADGAGNLYGTTMAGGDPLLYQNDGVVFELSPPAAGQTAWKTRLLYRFLAYEGRKGEFSRASLIVDGAGNLFGTTNYGGANRMGEVFEVSPPAAGQTHWTLKVLHSFNGADGQWPNAALLADSAGNLFGTTSGGGSDNQGTVFELRPPMAGQMRWTLKELHAFNGTDGSNPNAGLIAGSAGNLYGTTSGGGKYGDGVVFELTGAGFIPRR